MANLSKYAPGAIERWMTVPKNLTEQEQWMEGLGSKFVEVWLYIRGERLDERHIDDPETLETTVSMSMERLGSFHAVWLCKDGHWQLYDRRRGTYTCYPNKEAAEMVAIFDGR